LDTLQNDEIYDLLGVRILCDSTSECYQILGIVHRLWPPIEGRFKDYIAMPKANNYQSLHTTVMALDGKLLEIQIRTKTMHQIAEYGIASHWKYKAASGSDKSIKTSIDEKQFGKLLQQMENWSDEISQNPTFMDDLKTELLKDTILVFTPQGHLIELPYYATALDFAYKIHTEVGNHTAGAKANGSIISLDQRLKHTQVLEILTSPTAHPHLSWLKFAKTSSAKKKIKAWLNKNDSSVLIDKDIIAKPVAPQPGVPQTAERNKQQFTKNDIIVDGLVMTVASNPEAPMETLKTVEWSSRYFKCNTLLGLTNISFGMPQRTWLNGAYLAMAVSRGVTIVIANPADEEFMNVKAASDVLSNRDKDASIYLTRFAGSAQNANRDSLQQSMAAVGEVYRAIIEGNREEIESVLEQAVNGGESAEKLVHDCMIPAIKKVGELFDSKEYFLPQLIASAEAMKRGLAYLDPYLKEDQSDRDQKGRILIATVKGDIHDIGKNIVALMLNNQGFDVVDLGKDVSAEVIIEEARQTHPDIVALSALMTTTMVNMKKTIDEARREGLGCSFMVGGAVVTASYADEIGAAYARDGVEAVRVADILLRKAREK